MDSLLSARLCELYLTYIGMPNKLKKDFVGGMGYSWYSKSVHFTFHVEESDGYTAIIFEFSPNYRSYNRFEARWNSTIKYYRINGGLDLSEQVLKQMRVDVDLFNCIVECINMLKRLHW